ncbi:MAG TPA: hypothetical protein VLR88_06805, partial [Propionibacteriaceae bacterium]|nr:hypothetical protein [Propionibacteriaceae bacterium]
RLASGVFVMGEPTWHSHVWAGILIAGPSAVVGGSAAAHLQGFGDAPDVIDIWATGNAVRTGVRVAGLPSVVLHDGLRLGRGEPPRTSPARTILDCVRGLSDDDVVGLVTRASRVTPSLQRALREELASTAKVPHRRLLQDLVDSANRGVESPLEWRFVRDVARAHGLPRVQLQVSHRRGTRSDATFEGFALLAELDGFAWHAGRRDADQWRDNELLITSGRPTLRYGFGPIATTPCHVADQLARALFTMGWGGPLRRCRRCRRVPRL